MRFGIPGLHKDVLAHPRIHASYPVHVLQYRRDVSRLISASLTENHLAA